MSTERDNESLDQMREDIQSLKFDNERIIKPAITSINTKLDRDIYASKADVVKQGDKVDEVDYRTRNYPLVEKVVFGLVGLILIAVVTALVAVVVSAGGQK